MKAQPIEQCRNASNMVKTKRSNGWVALLSRSPVNQKYIGRDVLPLS